MMPSCNDFKRAMMKAPEYVTHSSASLRVGHVLGSCPELATKIFNFPKFSNFKFGSRRLCTNRNRLKSRFHGSTHRQTPGGGADQPPGRQADRPTRKDTVKILGKF
jgi:hypothetical protein